MNSNTQALDRLSAIEKEAAELRKIIEAPEQPKQSAKDYLLGILSKCTAKINIERKDVTWFDESGQWIFQQDFKNKCLWCYYYKVWMFFENEYSMNYQQVRELHTETVGMALGTGYLTPVVGTSNFAT